MHYKTVNHVLAETVNHVLTSDTKGEGAGGEGSFIPAHGSLRAEFIGLDGF